MLWLAIFGPPVAALLLAGLQALIYRGLVGIRVFKREQVPFFGVLVFRGLLILLADIVVITIALKGQVPLERDPLLAPEYQEQVRRMKAGDSPVASEQTGDEGQNGADRSSDQTAGGPDGSQVPAEDDEASEAESLQPPSQEAGPEAAAASE